MRIKALIFDVDGTLAETEEAHREAFNRTFDEAGLDWQWSVEDYTRLLKTTGGKKRMRKHRDDLGVTEPSDEKIADLHRRKTAIYAEIVASGDLSLRPGVRELVSDGRAAGIRVAVATTTNTPNVEALCQVCWGQPANQVFEFIAAGDEVAAKKTRARCIQLGAETTRPARAGLHRLGRQPQWSAVGPRRRDRSCRHAKRLYGERRLFGRSACGPRSNKREPARDPSLWPCQVIRSISA